MVALAVQQSLLAVDGGAPMVESARWIEGVILGDIALGLCMVVVALIGVMMLAGRLPLQDGSRVVIGCFVLLGAPGIAAGFVGSGSVVIEASSLPLPVAVPSERSRPHLPTANFDPYAGASLRED